MLQRPPPSECKMFILLLPHSLVLHSTSRSGYSAASKHFSGFFCIFSHTQTAQFGLVCCKKLKPTIKRKKKSKEGAFKTLQKKASSGPSSIAGQEEYNGAACAEFTVWGVKAGDAHCADRFHYTFWAAVLWRRSFEGRLQGDNWSPQFKRGPSP